jgi:hypothetical protein
VDDADVPPVGVPALERAIRDVAARLGRVTVQVRVGARGARVRASSGGATA